MNKLPPELYDEIIDWTEESKKTKYTNWKTKLARYAPISRMWKESVERRTFKKLTVHSNALIEFADMFRGANVIRRQALGSLFIRFIFPNPPDLSGCCVVTRVPDRNVESWVFTLSVRKLFIILSDLEQRLGNPLPISLCFVNASRRSYQFNKHDGYGVHLFRCKNHARSDIQEARATSGKYELYGLPMPALEAVHRFQFWSGRLLEKLKPTWVPTIMQNLQNLEFVEMLEGDEYEMGRRLRLQHRQGTISPVSMLFYLIRTDMSRSLVSLPRDTLVEFQFRFDHDELKHDGCNPHELVAPGMWREEFWSRLIRHLADYPHLRTLHCGRWMVVCPEFFLNLTEKRGLCFPSLEELVLKVATETADGNWFFDRDEELFAKETVNPRWEDFWCDHNGNMRMEINLNYDMEVFEDYPRPENYLRADRFRTKPNQKLFGSFLRDASRAFRRLEKIRKFVILMPNGDKFIYPFLHKYFELWWIKSGITRPIQDEYYQDVVQEKHRQVADEKLYLQRDRLYWRTGDWTPWIEVQEAWKAAAPGAKILHMPKNPYYNMAIEPPDSDSDQTGAAYPTSWDR